MPSQTDENPADHPLTDGGDQPAAKTSDDWSDQKKWVMGIISSAVVGLLAFVYNLVLVPGLHRVPDGLTRSGTLVVQHSGSRNPFEEGFSSGFDLAPPELQKQWTKIVLTPSHNPESWRIENPVLGACPYRFLLNDSAVAAALSKGWRFTLRARLLKLTDPLGVIHANFDTGGKRRYDLNIIRAYPRLGETNKALLVRLNTRVVTAEGPVGPVNDYPLEDDDTSHVYVMTYDPASELARVDFDGKKLWEGKYSGHSNYTFDKPMFEFGTSGAEATFELVRFEVF